MVPKFKAVKHTSADIVKIISGGGCTMATKVGKHRTREEGPHHSN